MNPIPKLMKKEIDRLSKKYQSLQEVYRSDTEWLVNGTMYLKGNNLKLANWFNVNTILFEKEFLKKVTENM